MSISYRNSADELTVDQMSGPFFVGWPNPPNRETHLEILQAADHVCLAMENNRLVGFATALSDGILSAFIPLLEVVPDRQGMGIGTELIRVLLNEIGDIYAVDVVTDPRVIPFYERLGFTPTSAGSTRNYQYQPGRFST